MKFNRYYQRKKRINTILNKYMANFDFDWPERLIDKIYYIQVDKKR